MTEIIEGMEAVSIHIRDIRKSRTFYSEVLGLKEVHYNEKISRAAFAIPGTSTVLTMHIQGPGEGGREPGTVSGIAFTNHDPGAACAEIRKRGGTITSEPELIKRPGMTMTLAVFADPDGNEFMIRSVPVRTE